MNSNKRTSGVKVGVKVPVDEPDSEAAKRPPAPEAIDRPGFDLGGARQKSGSDGKDNPK